MQFNTIDSEVTGFKINIFTDIFGIRTSKSAFGTVELANVVVVIIFIFQMTVADWTYLGINCDV